MLIETSAGPDLIGLNGSLTAAPAGPKHILDARQFSRQWLEEVLFPAATQLQHTPLADLPKPLQGKRLFYLLYEQSTRTRVSFEAAVKLLGGDVAGMDRHQHLADDESLEDRIEVLNQYLYDFILLRYHKEGGARRAAAVSRVPVISAGDGTGQHPTQALLDTYTIWREHGRLDHLRIALVGDLSYERTTNSLAYLLGQFDFLTVYLVSPQLLRMRDEPKRYLLQRGARVEEVPDLRSVASQIDVLYVTKAHSARVAHAQRYDGTFGNGGSYCHVDREVMAQLPSHAIVLHPLPRGEELPPEFDTDQRIGCFRQAQNGLVIRMALLSLIAQAN